MINTLIQEHSEILDTLDKIKEYGIGSRKGQEILLLAKNHIIKHIEREDNEFYPKIKEAAKYNKELKKVLKEFDQDMDQIKHYTLGFFDGFSLSNNKDMITSMERFTEILRRRILREDNILFPEFEKLQKKNT